MLFGNQHQPTNLLYDNLFHPKYILSTCNQWEQWSCHQQVDQPRVQTSRNPQLYGYTLITWNVNIYNPVLNGTDELLWKQASDIDVQSNVHECSWEHRKKLTQILLKRAHQNYIVIINMSLPPTNLHFTVLCSMYYQGFTNCAILPSRMGEHGVWKTRKTWRTWKDGKHQPDDINTLSMTQNT